MKLGFLARTLLLGALLSAGSAFASEIVTHAERPGGKEGTLSRTAGTDAGGKPKRQRLENARLEFNDATGATDTEKVSKKSGVTGGNGSARKEEAVPEKAPVAEPPHLMLRGVRG